MNGRLIFLILLVFSCVHALAQKEESGPLWHLHIAPSFSFSGFNSELGLSSERKNHRIGLGYKLLVSETAFFNQFEHGLYAYYSRDIVQQGKWTAAAHGRTIQSYRSGGGRTGEYLIGQELRFAISSRVVLSQLLGIGMYEETIVSARYDFKSWGYGADGIILLGVDIRLGK